MGDHFVTFFFLARWLLITFVFSPARARPPRVRPASASVPVVTDPRSRFLDSSSPIRFYSLVFSRFTRCLS